MKSIISNLVVLAVSSCLALLALEGAARLIVDPIDVLMPVIEHDASTGHRIKPGSGGHDRWGFRNKTVPKTAEVVAIGDSMTYGFAAPYREAWPTHFQRLTGQTVYNMGLGAYGPVQYLHLLKTKAASLKPKLIICAIYVENDLFDISNFSKEGGRLHNIVHSEGESDRRFHTVRSFLSRHSVAYRTITQSPLFDFIRHKEAAARFGSRPVNGHYFTPKTAIRWLNLNRPQVAQAYQRLENIIADMVTYSKNQNIELAIAIIPTKETVYFPKVAPRLNKEELESFRKLETMERELVKRIEALTRKLQVRSVDLLPSLRRAVGLGQDIYPFNDPHPNGAGYKVIAKTLNEEISRSGRKQ